MPIAIILILIGAALIETPLVGFLHGENGLAALIGGIVFGVLFIIPGVVIFASFLEDRKKNKKPDSYMKDLLEALKPGFKEAVGRSGLDPILVSFREHYSAFLGKSSIVENEEIQGDVTQIFRNIMQFHKNRLNRLGLTCEMTLRRMEYTQKGGISSTSYSDGKYNIIDVKEEVAAKTIYKRNGKVIHTKQDRDIANYTIIHAQKVGSSKIICPNCGAETTREALLDGCDYCGTRFTVEDLGSRIAVFAFRPDYKLRYEKYLRTRNKILVIALTVFVLAVFIGFTTYGIITFPTLLKEADGGIVLTLLGTIFAILVASPFYILALLIVYGKYIFPFLLIAALISWRITLYVRAKKTAPMLARELENQVRSFDPNFSAANFYSGIQNKLSSIIFAETKEQIQAFAEGDLTHLLGKYSNVAGVDVNNMEITQYYTDNDLQYATVNVNLLLTRCSGNRCYTLPEHLHLKLIKSADCKTQVVCAPAILTCKGCGASLDLLLGKKCRYCGKDLELMQYDWAIEDLKRGFYKQKTGKTKKIRR